MRTSKVKYEVIWVLALLVVALLALHSRREHEPAAEPTPARVKKTPEQAPLAKDTPQPLQVTSPTEDVYSIGGVSPGMTLQEVEELLGQSHTSFYGYEHYGQPTVAIVKFDDKRLVESVRGRWLCKNGNLLLRPPLNYKKVVAALGEPLQVWSNDSWCGNCRASETHFQGGVRVWGRLSRGGMLTVTQPDFPAPEGWKRVDSH